VGRHGNLCESRPDSAAPTPPPNGRDTDPFNDKALEFLAGLEL